MPCRLRIEVSVRSEAAVDGAEVIDIVHVAGDAERTYDLARRVTNELTAGFEQQRPVRKLGERPHERRLLFCLLQDLPRRSVERERREGLAVGDLEAHEVGVIGRQSEVDSIELTIKVIRKLSPDDCRETIPISHDFERTNYQGNKKNELSFMFSERILREKYETWMDSSEKSTSCK